jgi:hypothetical protein
MTRWSNRAEGKVSITGLQPLNGNQPSASRQPSRQPRIWTHDSVLITPTTSSSIDGNQPGEMVLQMNVEQIRVGRWTRGTTDQRFVYPCGIQTLPNGGKAGRLLGMPGPCPMV